MATDPFQIDLSYDEYRNQEVVETDDGAFFDECDRLVGIDPDKESE